MSKQRIYPPATIKKDFNLGIYRKLKNLFYICNIDHLIISTNSNFLFPIKLVYRDLPNRQTTSHKTL